MINRIKQTLAKYGYVASGYAGIPTGLFTLIGALQRPDVPHILIALMGAGVSINALQRAIWGKPNRQSYGNSIAADIGLTAIASTLYGIGGWMLAKPFIVFAAVMYLLRSGCLYLAAHGKEPKEKRDQWMRRASGAALIGALPSAIGMCQTLPPIWAAIVVVLMTINYGAPYFAPSPKKNAIETA